MRYRNFNGNNIRLLPKYTKTDNPNIWLGNAIWVKSTLILIDVLLIRVHIWPWELLISSIIFKSFAGVNVVKFSIYTKSPVIKLWDSPKDITPGFVA